MANTTTTTPTTKGGLASASCSRRQHMASALALGGSVARELPQPRRCSVFRRTVWFAPRFHWAIQMRTPNVLAQNVTSRASHSPRSCTRNGILRTAPPLPSTTFRRHCCLNDRTVELVVDDGRFGSYYAT